MQRITAITPATPGLSSRSAPINATWARRTLTLWAVALLKRVHGDGSAVFFLPNSLCIKHGASVDLAEAATLVYVKTHTFIPVPEVYCAFEEAGKTYIVMQRLPGRLLADRWLERSEESRAKILAQLKGMIDELRRLRSPFGSAIANVDGGSLTDPRLPQLGLDESVRGSLRFGPFKDVRAFHRWLRGLAGEPTDEQDRKLQQPICVDESPRIGLPVFTHGELSPKNILVKDDKVTGIVGWKTAGWYPPYWEYKTAMRAALWENFWRDCVDKFVEPEPDQLGLVPA